MTDLKKRILRELDVQMQHEGDTQNIRDVRTVLNHVQTSSEWQTLVSCRHHRYGVLSYETHRFYDLRPFVKNLAKDLLTSPDSSL